MKCECSNSHSIRTPLETLIIAKNAQSIQFGSLAASIVEIISMTATLLLKLHDILLPSLQEKCLQILVFCSIGEKFMSSSTVFQTKIIQTARNKWHILPLCIFETKVFKNNQNKTLIPHHIFFYSSFISFLLFSLKKLLIGAEKTYLGNITI